jgi:nitrite reductase (cytochrome c-552)
MGKVFSRQMSIYVAVFIVAAAIAAVVAGLLVNISNRKMEAREFPLRVVQIEEGEIDPAVWGRNFPHEYDTFDRTREDYGKTKYGGSTPYSKLEAYPAMVRLWAGYSFSKDHNEERGHHYTQIDQGRTKRVTLVDQPGACVNCHAAVVPALIAEMGWENFNRTPYNDLKDRLTLGSSCADCHDPETMDLRITRPALRNALEERGIDLEKATRQEMRTYVCAQCHVEYYFLGEDKVLTFPWSQGTRVEDIEAHYDDYGFSDWKHADTGAGMIKIQHPEFELWGTGIHARAGVSCADCHMPFLRVGSVKTSDHWVRSPLNNPNNSCGACHNLPDEEHIERVETIQDATAGLLRRSEEAIIAAIDAIVLAREAGASHADLVEALEKHRRASLRWDFVSSENSTGFHSPQEAARILAGAIDLARQAEMEANMVRLAAAGR